MPGGYGTSGPWGSSGSTTGTTKPGTSGGYSGGSNQQADNINRQREERREQQSNAYLNDASNFQTAQQQMAASLQAAGAVTSGALGGQALWNKIPADVADKIRRSGGDPTLYGNEYYSTFAEGAQAYSPTGIITIEGEDGIPAYISRDEDGNLIPNPDPLANKYKVFNPYISSHGGSGNNYNYRRGRGSLGQQMYAMGLPGIMYGDMQGENRYSPLNMNEFMVNVHSPMYANRGGIIDLLGDY